MNHFLYKLKKSPRLNVSCPKRINFQEKNLYKEFKKNENNNIFKKKKFNNPFIKIQINNSNNIANNILLSNNSTNTSHSNTTKNLDKIPLKFENSLNEIKSIKIKNNNIKYRNIIKKKISRESNDKSKERYFIKTYSNSFFNNDSNSSSKHSIIKTIINQNSYYKNINSNLNENSNNNNINNNTLNIIYNPNPEKEKPKTILNENRNLSNLDDYNNNLIFANRRIKSLIPKNFNIYKKITMKKKESFDKRKKIKINPLDTKIILKTLLQGDITIKKKKFINKLNLIYSENEKEFEKKYYRFVDKYNMKGLGLCRINKSLKSNEENIDNKIKTAKEKINFVKNIVYLTYYDMYSNLFNKNKKKTITYKNEDYKYVLNEYYKEQERKKNYLLRPIKISKINNDINNNIYGNKKDI